MFYQFLFKNRWIALAFVGFTLLSVYTLVGTEDDASVLGAMTGIAAQPDQNPAEMSIVEQPQQPEYLADDGMADFADDAYVGDEELIDPATGTDPTPMDGAEGAPDDMGGSPDSADDIPIMMEAEDPPSYIE